MTNTGAVRVYRAIIAAVVLAALPSVVEGQKQCAENVATVGSIGISLLDCDCEIGAPFADREWKFNNEPRITGIERNSPASGQLQLGDVIKSVGDVAITTPAGARLLTVLKPGQPLSIVVDRKGETVRRVLTAEAVCADDPYLLGMQAARASLTTAAGARAEVERLAELGLRATNAEARATTASQVAQERAAATRARLSGALMPTMRADAERAASVTGQAQAATTVTGARRAAEVAAAQGWRASTILPAGAWIGLGFSCSDCSIVQEDNGARWTFKTAPTVYAVEVGSPAYSGSGTSGMRRGDILTHIDGLDITTQAGGKRLGSVKPNQTVKLRYLRPTQGSGAVTREITIVAGQSRAPNAAAVNTLNRTVQALTVRDTMVSHTLRNYEASRRQEEEQEKVLTAAMQRLRSGSEQDEKQAEAMIRNYIASTSQLQRQQDMIVQELIASQRNSEVLEASRRSLTELTRAASARSAGGDQRLRYSGVFGANDVEVRGLSSVVVTENGNELIITTSDATIRLKKPVPLKR